MVENKSRFYLDLIKGIAIFLMLWGHCIEQCYYGSGLDVFENSVFQVIYSFHMPIFMLVSGYLFFYSFQKRELGELIAHRSKPLLFTLFFCGIFNHLMTSGLYELINGNAGKLIGGNIFSNLFRSLWFLWSVLVISVIISVVCKKIKRVWLQIAVLIPCAALLLFLFTPERHIFMYPYFLIGFYFAQYKDKLPKGLWRVRYASLALFPVMMLFYEKKHFVYTTGIFCDGYSAFECVRINGFRWAIGLIGSVFVLTVVELICRFVVYRMKRPILSAGMARLGQKSLQIYALSMAFLNNYLLAIFTYIVQRTGGENMLTRNIHLYNFGITLGLALVYAVALYGLVKLFEKIKLSKILFGR